MDYKKCLQNAFAWIELNSIQNEGIVVSSKKRVSYPEVTGYYIPTLLNWEKKEKAVQFAKWLLSIQKKDGSWFDSDDKEPYVFDTAQILKGMLAIRNELPEVKDSILNGCNWIFGYMQENGRLITPSLSAWGKDSFCSEMIHLYCLSPLLEAGKIYGHPEYQENVKRIAAYYIENHRDRIVNFNMLSHFYAYVMEGLFDIGEREIVEEAMEKMARIQKSNGMISGMKDVAWTCSTGCFQLALVWYKLGKKELGDKSFQYAAGLQNGTGGWYGSYPTKQIQRYLPGKFRPYYFEDAEISWAVKYFLDAYYWKNKLETGE